MHRARAWPMPALAVAAFLGGVAPASGQSRDCQLAEAERSVTRGSDEASRVSRIFQPVFLCDGGTRIRADSSIHNHGSAFHRFYGNVLFVDEGKQMTAPYAQYFARTGRLDARDGVQVVTLETGDTITGGELVLLQANDRRPEDQLTVRRGRPRAVFHPQESGASDADEPRPESQDSTGLPYEVVADVIYLEGEGVLRARGRVQIERDDLQAYADSTELDQIEGRLRLFRLARLVQDDLDVRGDTIEVLMPEDALEEIESRTFARMRAGDVHIEGYLIRAFFAEQELVRVVSLRKPPGELVADDVDQLDVRDVDDEPPPEVPDSLFPQALARAENFRITADSIEVNVPGGELKRVFAAGGARAESTARDSLNTPRTAPELRTDWLSADTVIAAFLPPVEGEQDDPDEEENGDDYRLDTLLGRVSAKTFYRVVARDTALVEANADGTRPLELNYTLGDEIKIFLSATAEVDSMHVENPVGAYFQPVRRARPTPPDTTGVIPPDTTGSSRPIPRRPAGRRR